MADYNLGNARGTVEIDYDDRGIQEAEKSFQKLEQIAARLDKALSGTRRAAINAGRAFRDANGGLGPMINNMKTAHSAVNSYVSAVTRAQRSTNLFTSEIRRISNVTMLVRGLGTALGVFKGADVSKLPTIVQQIMALNSAFVLFRAMEGHLTSLAARFGILAKASALLATVGRAVYRFSGLQALVGGLSVATGFLATRFGTAGRAAWTFAKSLPIIGGLFSKVGAGAGALAGRFAAVGGAMGHFGGTTRIVNKALRDTLGVTESVARSVTRLGFFALNVNTAWKGFAALGRMIAKAAVAAGSGITLLVGAVQLLGTAVAGTLNGLKTMSGILAIIPGILAVAGAAGGVLALGLKGMKDAFGSLGGTLEDFNTATENMAPSAKEALGALREFAPRFKEMQKSVQGVMFDGMAKELERVGGPIMDTLEAGTAGVADAFSHLGRQVVSFVGEAQTTKDIGTGFKATEAVVRNLGTSMRPLLSAFRDIGLVGAQVFAQMSIGMGSATQRFADFIREARNTGKIEGWIRNAVQAFRDFGTAMSNLGSIVKTVFEQFGVTGDNAMARFAKSTGALNDWFQSVTNGGEAVGAFADRLNAISDRYIAILSTAWDALGDNIADAAGWFEKVTHSVDGGLRKAITVINGLLEATSAILSPFSGVLATVVGGFIASAIALKALAIGGKAIAPIVAGFAALSTAAVSTGRALWTAGAAFNTMGQRATVAGVQMGAFGTGLYRLGTFVPFLRSMQVAFVSTTASLTAMAASAGLSGAAVTGLARAFGLASAAANLFKRTAATALMLIGGPAGAAMIAIMALGAGMVNGLGMGGKAAEVAGRQVKMLDDATENMLTTWTKADGVMNADVFGSVVESVQAMKDSLKSTAEEAPSWWGWTSAAIADTFTLGKMFGTMGDSSIAAASDLDEMGTSAETAFQDLDKIGMTTEDLATAMTSGGSAIRDVIMKLSELPSGGGDAIKIFQEMANRVQDVQAAMGRMGSSVALSNAIAVIGDEASSASDKLNAMKSALQALGILDTSIAESMFAVTEAIGQIASEAETAFTSVDQGGSFLNEMGTGFDYTSQNSAKLFEQLSLLSGKLQDVASNGGDVGAAYAQMDGTLNQLGKSTNLGRQKIDELARTVGLAPKELMVLAAVEGTDVAIQQIAQVALELTRAGRDQNKPISLKVNSEAAIAAIEAAGAAVQRLGNGEIVVKASNEQALAALDELAKKGFDVSAIKPLIIAAADTGAAVTGLNGVAAAADNADAKNPNITTTTTGVPQTTAELGQVQGAAAAADGQNVTVTTTTAGAPAAEGEIAGVQQAAAQPTPPVVVDVSVSGAEGVIGGLESINGSIEASKAKWAEYQGAIEAAMAGATAACQTAASSCGAALSGAASGAFASGSALGQGFANGIQSQVGAVAAAAQALAAAASAPLPNSPAKVGPFSGKGWTPFRGMALAEGFAEGIKSGTPLAANASLGMVGQVSAAIDSLNSMFGRVQSSFNANTDISSTKFYRTGDKTDEELKAENAKKVADRIASDERSAKKQAQEEAKQALKEGAKEAVKEKSAEQVAKDEAKAAEDAAEARYKRAMQVIEEGVSSDAEVADSVNAMREKGIIDNDDLANAIAVAGRQNSSDAEVIQALQQIEAAQARTDDISNQDELANIEDAIKSRRGIEEYDPFANASQDVVGDSIKVAQDLFGMINSVKQGLTSAKDLATLLIRGMSSTNDIMAAVDGFQDVANGIGGILSTVGDVAGTIGGIAASFGQMIPGIGQLISGIGLVTGGLSQANAIIDLVQTGFDFLGGIAGTALSALAGGKDGALMGNVKTLIDTNDKTIKRWSDNDPTDKRSSSYGKAGPAKNTAVENLNIYQGPGQDPYKMVETGMFAVKTYAAGVYN